MVLKLYADPHARGASAIVAMVLAEKQIPFELIQIDLEQGEHKKPDFVQKHPFGQVPVIDDNGFILYESRAISRYLAEKYPEQGTRLIPVDPKKKALFEQAASIEFANFHPRAVRIIDEKFRKPSHGQPVDQDAVVEAVAELSATLNVYEDILGRHKFVAGDELTLADLFHVAVAPMFAASPEIAMGPNTARWWNDVISRPTWIKLAAEGIKSTETY
ncbi:glutathione S-transferase [Mycena maculata]|uniref:glutathione transferase n=1 Tax=Mycena maculata TaxID=230809 RepID=A0AAD7NVC2_9AGAR|nr:glutathione S-transferase [Mycena maculata]